MKKLSAPVKYQPKGYEILFEDSDLIIGNKSAGELSVAALWNKTSSIHDQLKAYVKKGNSKSNKSVFAIHRLDQATSGVLMFAKSEEVMHIMKSNWKSTQKTYYAIAHGNLKEKKGLISSYLSEDEDYHVHSSNYETESSQLAQTEYQVVKENSKYSILKINLLTGKKNQIRVHFADKGHPLVGDSKYGTQIKTHGKNLMLHSFAIVFNHPHSNERIRIQTDVPEYFYRCFDYKY